HPASALYNYELQKKVCSEVHPLKLGIYNPIPYPPFVGTLFQPFAKMSYETAYLTWLPISFLLYGAGLAMVSARFFAHDPLRRSLIFCLALCFYPFLTDTLLTGHLSTIGF